VRHLSGVVLVEPCRYVVRDPDVEVFSIETF
jgi:hypothetical protein